MTAGHRQKPLGYLATTIAAAFLAVALLAGCGAAPVDDVCVPPTPSPTGAPWTEADDGEPCVRDGAGGWTEDDDIDLHHRHPAARTRAVTPPVTTGTRTPIRHDRTTRARASRTGGSHRR